MTPFDQWVAREVDYLMWSFDEYQQELQRERSLTYAQSGMDACQGGFDIYFDSKNPASTPLYAVVPTNLTVFH